MTTIIAVLLNCLVGDGEEENIIDNEEEILRDLGESNVTITDLKKIKEIIDGRSNPDRSAAVRWYFGIIPILLPYGKKVIRGNHRYDAFEKLIPKDDAPDKIWETFILEMNDVYQDLATIYF